MHSYQIIESKENAQVKRVVRLARESKFRHQEQQAIIYGEHLVVEAMKCQLLSQVFILQYSYEKYGKLLHDSSVKIVLVSTEIMSKLNLLDSEIDILAIVNFPKFKVFDNNSDCIILENIQNPGNLGTVLRAASASGIKQVVLSSSSVDIYNPKVLRASQGIQFSIHTYIGVDVFELINNYKGQVLAMTPHAKNSLYDCDLSKPTALILGNEGSGLSLDLLNQISNHIKIPMIGNAESINLAMAATVAAFEMSRQRIKVPK